VVDDTTVVVLRVSGGEVTLTCGGLPMVDAETARPAEEDNGPTANGAEGDSGAVVGKRYVDAYDAVEVLCIKPGTHPLALDGAPLRVKAARPLPASD
jgi:hypothetical protein